MRVLCLLTLHLLLESLLLIELWGLWVASRVRVADPGAVVRASSTTTWCRATSRSCSGREPVLHLEIVTQGPAPDAFPGHPLLVCSRHAGPATRSSLCTR